MYRKAWILTVIGIFIDIYNYYDAHQTDLEYSRSRELWEQWLTLKEAMPDLEDILIESAPSKKAFVHLVRTVCHIQHPKLVK
jgi:hypothetical protein